MAWGGLVFKAHRLVYHSTLGWRVITKQKKKGGMGAGNASGMGVNAFSETPALGRYRGTPLIRNSAPLGPYSRTMPRALW